MTKTDISAKVIPPSGGYLYCYYSEDQANNIFSCFSSSTVCTSGIGRGFTFGTGSTPPTINDYKLSGDAISTLALVANLVTADIFDGVYRFTNSLTINNTGGESVTISEIVVGGSCAKSSTSSSVVVYDRTVLDTPLTLAPGEQGVITYTFNLPIVQ